MGKNFLPEFQSVPNGLSWKCSRDRQTDIVWKWLTSPPSEEWLRPLELLEVLLVIESMTIQEGVPGELIFYILGIQPSKPINQWRIISQSRNCYHNSGRWQGCHLRRDYLLKKDGLYSNDANSGLGPQTQGLETLTRYYGHGRRMLTIHASILPLKLHNTSTRFGPCNQQACFPSIASNGTPHQENYGYGKFQRP